MLEEVKHKKREFALAWLRDPYNPYRAAATIFAGQVALATAVSMQWISDPEVLKERARLIAEHGEEHFLPSKAELARKVYETADNCVDPETKFKGFKLFGEIMGMIEKPGVSVNNNTQINNKVMVVPNYGDANTWEQQAIEQQRSLTDASQG